MLPHCGCGDDDEEEDEEAGVVPSDAAHTLLVNVGSALFLASGCAAVVLTGVCESVLASVERIPLLLELLELLLLWVLGGEAVAVVAPAAAVVPGDVWCRACGVMLPGTAVVRDVRQNDIREDGKDGWKRKEMPSVTHTHA